MAKSQKWTNLSRWALLVSVGIFLLLAVLNGVDRDLPGVVRSLGMVALILGLGLSRRFIVGMARTPRIMMLRLLLLTVATGAFLWAWSHTDVTRLREGVEKASNLPLAVAGLIGLGRLVWDWSRRRAAAADPGA
jgi:hypothetical protein